MSQATTQVHSTVPATDRAALRTSESRRSDLEYASQRRTKEWDLTLSIDASHKTAHVEYKPDSGRYEIVISGREFDQPVTEYEPQVWDRLAQTVLTLHENAHVLYTDFDDVTERLESRNLSKREEFIYHRIHNGFEDGRIEVLIRVKYPSYSTHLLHFRANFMQRNLSTDATPNHDESDESDESATQDTTQTLPDDGQCTAPSADGTRCGRSIRDENDTCWQHDDEEACAWENGESVEVAASGWQPPTQHTERVVGFMQAITMGALDRTTFNSTKYDKLTDPDCDTYRFKSADDRETFMSEIHPRLEACADEIVDETDAQVANERIFTFCDEIIDHLDAADKDGVDDAQDAAGNGDGPGGMPDDSGRSGKPSASPEQMPDMGDDEDDGESASAGDETDEESDEDDTDGAGGSGDENDESDDEGEDEAAGGTDDEGDEDDDETGAGGDEVEADDEIADEIAEQVAREAQESESADASDDDSAIDAAVKAASESGGLSQHTVEDVPNNGYNTNDDIWSKATTQIQHIKKRINLSDDKACEVRRNQRHGSVDGAALPRAMTGDTRDYKRAIAQPDTPEFNLCIVLDRSGSMHSTERRTAISAVVQFARALASYRHVNVMVLELYDKKVRRAMPLGADPETYKRALLHDKKDGGTPLTDALALARERLGQESGPNVKNRVFVVTDGSPDDTDSYETELQAAQMPVVGLSITNGNGAGARFYHRHETVPKGGRGLTTTLTGLANELTEH